MRREAIILLLVLILLPFVVGNVFINEVEINPAGTDAGNEWIELYNNNTPVNLTGWYIMRSNGNNFSLPSTIINDFYVFDSLSFLTPNTNQSLNLFDNNNISQDNTENLTDNDNDNRTWQRIPDGTGSFVFQTATKGISNNILGNITINGAGNYLTIQDAINNASSGDLIEVKTGNYNENVIINNKQKIIIRGINAVLIPSNGIGFAINNSDGITIKNFTMNTTGLNAHGIWIGGTPNGYGNSDNLTIQDNKINVGGRSSGIYAEQVNSSHSNWKITGNIINAPNSGVNLELYDVNNVLINNNSFGLSGSVSLVYSSENSNVGNAIISNNIFNGNGNISGATPTIWIESDFQSGDGSSKVNSVSIINNQFFNWVNYGIRIGESGINYDNVSNVLINYNSFNSGTGPAISNEIDNKIFNAIYNYWNSCDGPGPVASGSGFGISSNLTYSPWIGACVTEKTQMPSCVIENENITLYANVTSKICIGNVTFSVNSNGTWINYTGKKSDTEFGNYSYTFNLESLGRKTINWKVYADDCYNHTTRNENGTFYVLGKTSLNVNPLNPDGLNNWYISEPTFSLTNADAVNISYRWDGMGPFLYSSLFGLENSPNNGNITGGILKLTYWSNLICMIEPEQNQTFFFDFKNPEIKELFPQNNSIVYKNNSKIESYIDEVYQSNSGISENNVFMSLNGLNVSASVFPAGDLDAKIIYNAENLSEGWNNVSVYAIDNSGRSSEKSWRFFVNLSYNDFNFNVDIPEGIYGMKKIQFNVSTNKRVKEIEYINLNDSKPKWKTLCKECYEYGDSKIKTNTLNEGDNFIVFKATGFYDNIKEENISIFIDSKEPKISKIFPRRNSVINGSYFYIEYTEDNLREISLNWNPEIKLTQCNQSGKNRECEFGVNLNAYDGESIDFWFNISDGVRSVSSKKTRVLIDTTSPILNVNMPINTNYIKKIPFNISVSENVNIEYYDNSDSNSKWRMLCVNCKDYGVSKQETKFFKAGSHNLLIRAIDKAGNSDEENINFNVS